MGVNRTTEHEGEAGGALLRLLDETLDLGGSLEIHMRIGVGAVGGVERLEQLSPPMRVGLVEGLQVLRDEFLCVLLWSSYSVVGNSAENRAEPAVC
jgi:hypothetical protein